MHPHEPAVNRPARRTIPALPGPCYRGTVRVVNVAADPATRTYMARVSVPNPHQELKIGMVAEVSITGSQRLDLLMVPAEAIVRDPQGATLVFQYFPDQQRVYSKRVEIGSFYGRDIQVRSGLLGQEPIVVAGQNTLRNGMAAEPIQGGK
jgi:multidrug efflux pump subunit AcrA (membrane-fusion protein)